METNMKKNELTRSSYLVDGLLAILDTIFPHFHEPTLRVLQLVLHIEIFCLFL